MAESIAASPAATPAPPTPPVARPAAVIIAHLANPVALGYCLATSRYL